jgi:hypothetical protein
MQELLNIEQYFVKEIWKIKLKIKTKKYFMEIKAISSYTIGIAPNEWDFLEHEIHNV